MEFITEELKAAKDLQRLSIPAKRLKEKLAPIPSTFESLRRRWFWELLQNASDYNETVSVRLELYVDKIIFSHNGAPFKPIDTENLISPDSGKDDEDIKAKDPIGQFGTGFISTHVLSSEITVSGIVASQNYKEQYIGVRFKLDRSLYESKDGLIASIKNAERQLENETYDAPYIHGAYSTTFSYDLTKPFPMVDAINTVEEGLKNIDELLPYTLILMKKVQTVEIINHCHPKFDYPKRTIFKRGTTTDSDFHIVHCPYNEHGALLTENNYHFKVQKEGDSMVVVRVMGKRILPYSKDITKLFCSLPMIGTEHFCLPFVLNSTKFIPTTERHKVELSGNDTANRTILTDSIKAFKTLVDKLINEGFHDFFHLVCFGEPSDVNPTVNTWLKDLVLKPIQNNLSDQAIVNGEGSKVLKLSQSRITYIPREDFLQESFVTLTDIIIALQKENVPREDDVLSCKKSSRGI